VNVCGNCFAAMPLRTCTTRERVRKAIAHVMDRPFTR
jgi:hypothetical protein